MLELGYIGLTLLMSLVLVGCYNLLLLTTGIDNSVRLKKLIMPIVGLTAWFVYTYLWVASGLLNDLTLPPRLPLALIFPLFGFTAIFLYKFRNNELLHSIPIKWTVWFQSFRIIVELLMYNSFLKGQLQYHVTLEGYNYDIVFGASAVVVGLLVYVFKIVPQKWLFYWNYLGVLVLVSVIILFITTSYMPNLWGSQNSLMNLSFVQTPAVLVASFLMPIAIFVHFLAIVRLTRNTQLK